MGRYKEMMLEQEYGSSLDGGKDVVRSLKSG